MLLFVYIHTLYTKFNRKLLPWPSRRPRVSKSLLSFSMAGLLVARNRQVNSAKRVSKYVRLNKYIYIYTHIYICIYICIYIYVCELDDNQMLDKSYNYTCTRTVYIWIHTVVCGHINKHLLYSIYIYIHAHSLALSFLSHLRVPSRDGLCDIFPFEHHMLHKYRLRNVFIYMFLKKYIRVYIQILTCKLSSLAGLKSWMTQVSVELLQGTWDPKCILNPCHNLTSPLLLHNSPSIWGCAKVCIGPVGSVTSATIFGLVHSSTGNVRSA